jgi:hypothetical protein
MNGASGSEAMQKRTGLHAGTDLWANTNWRAGV